MASGNSPPVVGSGVPAGLDPVDFEVVRNALANVTEEMALTMRRAAYSTNVKTRGDFSCAVFDRHLQCVAQSFGQPAHLVYMCIIVPGAVREFGIERLKPGDQIIVNDPHRGSSHLNDITCITPAIIGGRLVGYVATMAHHVDVGGSVPASFGNSAELFQEGFIIPPTRLVAEGELDPNILGYLLANVRAPREMGGDLRAQVSAAAVGVRRLSELLQRYRPEVVDRVCEALVVYTARWTENEIRSFPEGIYRAEGALDDDGHTDEPVRLCVSVEIRDGYVTLDAATGSAPQRAFSFNCTRWMSFVPIAFVVRCLVNQAIPLNSGFLSRIRSVGPQGTVCSAVRPAAVAGSGETMMRLCDLIWEALHPAMPDRVPAPGKGLLVLLGIGGHDPRREEYFAYMETIAGGNGARPGKDGPDAVQTNMTNTENAPIEEIELNYPLLIGRYELIPDSCGAGRWRGGLGLRRDFVFPYAEATVTLLTDGCKSGPRGLAGGGPAQPAAFILSSATTERRLPSKITFSVSRGDTLSIRTPGGGGMGHPVDRDPVAVHEDLRNAKITADYEAIHYRRGNTELEPA